MDTQTIELLGQNWLVSELLRAGVEVAIPLRDRGIDLIAYLDLDDELGVFAAVPIQMKATTRFVIDKKYAKFPNLLYTYVWGLADDEQEPVTYALTHAEAVGIATEMGYTETQSWQQEKGLYSAKPSKRLIELLEPHIMTPESWRQKIVELVETT